MNITAPKTASQALAQALRLERARQIITEGYAFDDSDAEMIAVVKPGDLHTSYWLTEGATVCDCKDFEGSKQQCKHLIAYQIVREEAIPMLISTSPETVKTFCEKRDAERAATVAQEALLAGMTADAEAAEIYPY